MVLAVAALAFPPAAQAGGALNVSGHVGQRTDQGEAAPLEGASVILQMPDGTPVSSTTTDSAGNYGFASVNVGSYELVASKAGYVTQCRTFAQTGNPATPAPIELPTPAQADSLSGSVIDSFTHASLQAVNVEVSYEQGCDPVVSIQTGSNGQYFLPSLPGPEHLVTFSLAGYHSETHTATVFDPFGPTVLNAALDQVDVTPPKTRIKSVTVKGRKARVEFRGSDPPPSSGGLNFTCQLDQGTPEACESPERFRGLSDGRHRVRVVVHDRDGNSDPTPAKVGFKIG